MQVTFFVDKYPCYSETFIQSQIDGLALAGVQVNVITLFSDADIPKAADIRVNAIYTYQSGKFMTLLQRCWSVLRGLGLKSVQRSLWQQKFRLLRSGLFLPALASQWQRKYNHIDADIILAHFGTTGVTAAMLMELGLLHGKLVTVFHGFELSEQIILNRYRAAYAALFNSCALCMPVSQLWASRLTELGCAKEKILVHHMGIYPDSFTMLDPERALHQPLRLLSVARLVEKKGLEDAIAAVAILKQQKADVTLKIIGDGPLRSALQNQIAALKLTDRIELTGALAHTQVRQALEESDIFILPSKTAANGDMEGIPVSLMEAMARGLLVVSTEHSGITELISHNQSGYLAAENSPLQLAAWISHIANTADVAAMRLNARQRIETDFNQQLLNQKLLATLQRLYATP